LNIKSVFYIELSENALTLLILLFQSIISKSQSINLILWDSYENKKSVPTMN